MKQLAMVIMVFFSLNASAMRCGTQLILEGDNAFDVRTACGEPDYVEDRGVYKDAAIWWYKQSGGLVYRLLIKQGIVYSIEFHRG